VVPTITVRTEFGNITRQAINLNAEIDITNPNTVDLFIGNIFLNVTTEVGKPVGNFIILGSQIPAESAVTVHGHGTVIIEALNAKKLLINLHAEAGANIAGINKSLPFSSHIEIAIPDLNQFIPADKPLELELKPDLSLARGGIKSNMTLEVINPTKIPLLLSDIAVVYYGYKNNQKYYVAEGSLGSGELVPEGTTFFYGEALLRFSKLFNLTGRVVLPEMIFAQLRAQVSVSGVNLSIPVSLGSYIDIEFLHPS
jgi:LEA14-like dessication related protein